MTVPEPPPIAVESETTQASLKAKPTTPHSPFYTKLSPVKFHAEHTLIIQETMVEVIVIDFEDEHDNFEDNVEEDPLMESWD